MKIYLKTQINASPQVCFDLSRDIDLHTNSMQHTGERAVNGVTSGLIGLNDFVTWEARHFGIKQHLTTKITEFENPAMFIDEQLRGPFKRMWHRHTFSLHGDGTLMADEFVFESPLGVLGRLVDKLILKAYLTKLLTHRNQLIKQAAEEKDVNAI